MQEMFPCDHMTLCKFQYLPRALSRYGDSHVSTLRPRQNGRHFADDTFKYIFVDENITISAKISLKFVPNGPIDNIPALVQIISWRRPGDRPLSEPMMVRLLTHICVTRPQWVKSRTTMRPSYLYHGDPYSGKQHLFWDSSVMIRISMDQLQCT